MTNLEFRDTLARLGFSQSAFARLMTEHGDHSNPETILRRVQRWCSSDYEIPGEAVVIINLVDQLAHMERDAVRQLAA